MGAWPVEVVAVAGGWWPRQLRSRMGLRCPSVQPGSWWIHGASLGEVRVGRRVAEVVERAFVTTDTAAGLVAADGPRPFDHRWALAPLWAEARPVGVLFVEGAWWPALVRMARRAGVPVGVVGARPSSGKRVLHALFGWPDFVFPRTVEDGRFYRRHAVVHPAVGTLKGGRPPPNPLRFTAPFIVGGCTHHPEEEALVEAWRRVCPDHALVLAPRRVERAKALAARWGGVLRSQVRGSIPGASLVVVDTLGELPALYRGARATFIGGTFDPAIGGHSPAEALHAGVPVFHGPSIRNNAPAFRGTVQVGAIDRMDRGLRATLGARAPTSVDRLHVVGEILARYHRWAPETEPRPWARPTAPLYRARRRFRGLRPPLRAIGVGSPNARGAGKTRLAAFVARGLEARGIRVGILTRGTGARFSWGDSRIHGPSVDRLGDEGAVLAQEGFRVVAGPLEEGMERLRTVDVVVVEDGLQRRRYALTVAIHDARYPRARGPFPAGEDRGALQEPDWSVWVRGAGPGLRGWFEPGPWSAPLPARYVAFAGIGRPADFFATLDAVATRAFPDHHRYGPADLRSLERWADGLPLVCTTRDAVRLPATFPVIHRGVHLEVPDFPWDALLARLP